MMLDDVDDDDEADEPKVHIILQHASTTVTTDFTHLLSSCALFFQLPTFEDLCRASWDV